MRLILAAVLLAVVPIEGRAQSPSTQAPPNSATTLGRGWTALGAQQPGRALEQARRLLQANPRSHEAVALAIAALTATHEAIPALDEYERWLAKIPIEDPLLLQPVALATLEQMSAGKDPALALAALEHLADGGHADGRERLQAARTAENALAVDAALLRLGDRSAAGRLIDNAATGKGGGVPLVQALAAAGPASVPGLQRLLADPAGPTRAAAVRALGKLEAREALPAIRSRMTDPDPLVRARAAVALARMGDTAAEQQVTQMLASPVADLRLVAAEAYADRGIGPWLDAILPLLKDPAGLTRLMAAELVAPVNPDAARATLTEAAEDPNPVVKSEAIRLLGESSVLTLTAADWPTLRRWLRDAEPAVRLQAAGMVLELTSGRGH